MRGNDNTRLMKEIETSRIEYINERAGASNSRAPGWRKAVAGVVLGTTVLFTGCSSGSAEKPNRRDEKSATSPSPTTTTTQKPVLTGPELDVQGSAATVEKATTREQNAEFRKRAETLADTNITIFNDEIALINYSVVDTEKDSRTLYTISEATDRSGVIILETEQSGSSMSPKDTKGVRVTLIEGSLKDNEDINNAVESQDIINFDQSSIFFSYGLNDENNTMQESSQRDMRLKDLGDITPVRRDQELYDVAGNIQLVVTSGKWYINPFLQNP